MNMDIKRFKNYGLWVAIFSLIPMVLTSLGVKVIPADYEEITTTILTILAMLGILNNPTTECKWYKDENGNKIIEESDSKQDIKTEKVIYESDKQVDLYALIGNLIKDKVSNMSKIDNIEALLKQNLEGEINYKSINQGNESILKEDDQHLIKRNIEEMLEENAEELIKENLEKFSNDNITKLLQDNIEHLIKEEFEEVVKNSLLGKENKN